MAIVGMAAVHFGPTDREGLAGGVYALPHGRAAILFAVVAGVGVALLAGDGSPARQRALWARVGYRALLLLPLGLALQMLDHGILVILQYYAIFYLVLAAASRLTDPLLLGTSFAVLVVGPLVYLAVWHHESAWFENPTPGITDPPLTVAREIFVTGAYPVLTWGAPLLFALWLGRRDLRRTQMRLQLLIGGGAVALAVWGASWGLQRWLGAPEEEPSWMQLVLGEPHSQMPLWLAGSAASATAVLGALLIAVDRFPRVTWPLVATGQLAFTVYVTHLVVLHAWPDVLRADDVAGATFKVARFALVAALAAVIWRHLFPRGPLEAVLRLPWIGRRP